MLARFADAALTRSEMKNVKGGEYDIIYHVACADKQGTIYNVACSKTRDKAYAAVHAVTRKPYTECWVLEAGHWNA